MTARLARTPAERAAAADLRHEVFVGEQGVPPELERDGRDGVADHAVVLDDTGRALATARLLPAGDTAVIGRVAVRSGVRGGGLGSAVMDLLERRAADLGLPVIELHAQTDVIGFYRRRGYGGVGNRYLEAGIEHLTMRRELLPGLRPVRDDDGPALIALIGAAFAEYPGCVLDVDREEPWLRAPATTYATFGGDLWIVPGEAGVDACGGWRPGPDGGVELKNLYVAAAARRRGLGAGLSRRVERAARERGADRVGLWTDTRFTDAHRLYERLGYVRTGRVRELHDLSDTSEYEFVRVLSPLDRPPHREHSA